MTSRAATDCCDGWPSFQFCERRPSKTLVLVQSQDNEEGIAPSREAAAISPSPVSSQHTALVNFNVSRQTPLGMTVFGKSLRSWLKGSPSAGRNQQLHLSVALPPCPFPTGEGSVETRLVVTSRPVSKCTRRVPEASSSPHSALSSLQKNHRLWCQAVFHHPARPGWRTSDLAIFCNPFSNDGRWMN